MQCRDVMRSQSGRQAAVAYSIHEAGGCLKVWLAPDRLVISTLIGNVGGRVSCIYASFISVSPSSFVLFCSGFVSFPSGGGSDPPVGGVDMLR